LLCSVRSDSAVVVNSTEWSVYPHSQSLAAIDRIFSKPRTGLLDVETPTELLDTEIPTELLDTEIPTQLLDMEAATAEQAAQLESLESAVYRSEETHQMSMASMLSSMTSVDAVAILEERNRTTPALMEAATFAFGQQSNLRKHSGFGGLEGARKLLNDMIYESMTKYDTEISKCTDYYSRQCAAMEGCRGKIASANFIAANSRALILDAQGSINRCEKDIPIEKLELKDHIAMCRGQVDSINKRLKIVMGDIEVMTFILEMTDCDANKKGLLQHSLQLRCDGACTNKSAVTFDDPQLRLKLSHLQSAAAHDLISSSFMNLFGEQEPKVKVTEWNNPPIPFTKVPGDGWGPYPEQYIKKCPPGQNCMAALSNPQCYKLQGRFLLIQAGIADERDDLMDQVAALEGACKERQKTLEASIQNAKTKLSDSQTKLAAATSKEATAAETGRQTAAEHKMYDADLVKQMKLCSTNYIAFETELCALKKIRGELYKKNKEGHAGFFQDCEVSKWEPEECTKKCAGEGESGGDQKLSRSVLTPAKGGAKCLPLTAMKGCNHKPCPVNCKLEAWSGWTKCSSKCNGGLTQRVRDVDRAARSGGRPCAETTEAKACNNHACEKDCDLSEWTQWTGCSKDCDGGSQKRQRFIQNPAEGAGTCADEWSEKRMQYKKCNMHRCRVPVGQAVPHCNRSFDVILLIDGSSGWGKKGFASEIKASQMFVDAFAGDTGKANMAVILYSGPKTWSGVSKCTGESTKKVDMEKTCKIKTLTHFTKDLKKVKQLIAGLEWPGGSALTSLALTTAHSELSLGRPNARSNVVVFTNGDSLSHRKVGLASRVLRKASRLVWVPILRNAPLKDIKAWATRRWQENVVSVPMFSDLEKPDTVTHIIANICPAKTSKRNGKLRYGAHLSSRE